MGQPRPLSFIFHGKAFYNNDITNWAFNRNISASLTSCVCFLGLAKPIQRQAILIYCFGKCKFCSCFTDSQNAQLLDQTILPLNVSLKPNVVGRPSFHRLLLVQENDSESFATPRTLASFFGFTNVKKLSGIVVPSSRTSHSLADSHFHAISVPLVFFIHQKNIK